MHIGRSYSVGAMIACGLESAPASCVCPTANTSALQQSYYPPTANCAEFTTPVTFEAENIVFDFPKWDDDYALEDFLSLATTRASANFPSVAAGTKDGDGDPADCGVVLFAEKHQWEGEDRHSCDAWYWTGQVALELTVSSCRLQLCRICHL